MPFLEGKRGTWEFDHVHTWRGRHSEPEVVPHQLFDRASNLFFLGSCAAVWLTATLRRWGFNAKSHPDGHLYDTKTILQAVRAANEEWPQRDTEGVWELPDGKGFLDPFAKSYTQVLGSPEEVLARRASRDAKAARQMRGADVVFVFAEFAEVFPSPSTENHLILLPPPQIAQDMKLSTRMQTVEEIKSDLRAITEGLRRLKPGVELVFSTSGIPLFATLLPGDVRSASMKSVARLHSAMSEFAEGDDSVHFLPVADFVRFSDDPLAFAEEDGRHYNPRAVELFGWHLLRTFGGPDAQVDAPPSLSLIASEPQKDRTPIAPTTTVNEPSRVRRLAWRAKKRLKESIPQRYLPASLRKFL